MDKRGRRKRSNIMALFLVPVLIFIFFMGWSMYWIGDQKRPKKRKEKPKRVPPTEKDNVTLIPAILEQKPEITDG